MTTLTRPDRSVTTRRMTIEHEEGMPRHFLDGDLLMSHVMAVLSATFPKGEQFFVDSVRNYRDQIDDDELRRQVAGFIGQESMHGREHDRLNETLARLGYPTRFVDAATGRAMAVIQRVAPKSVQLAFTAAAEHFTSVLAEQLLEDDPFEDQDVPEELRALFRWHALEEAEHKAVAFDVFDECVHNEAIRLATMHVTTALLVAVAGAALVGSAVTDPAARNPIRFVGSLLNLRNSPFARKKIGLRLLEYHRPGFHPDDRDTEDLVARWREALFGEEGTLNGYLAGQRQSA
ncbi:MAG TPA: metal-dependent hydrolase [Acidimicrobiales bacterium]|nr:metal-dependent hydrolase [Acidimicrobiales bacterium]